MIPASQASSRISGVLPGLVVVVPDRAPAYGTPVEPVTSADPVAGGRRGLGVPRSGSDDPIDQLSSRSGAVLVLCFVVVALFGLVQGVSLLLTDPGPSGVAGAVALVLGSVAMPPGVLWVAYRRLRPRTPSTPWEGLAPLPDPDSHAELLVSPAGAIRDAAVAGIGLLVILLIALRITAVAWAVAVPLTPFWVLLVHRMLHPTVLVVNRRGFGVRHWRPRRRIALAWPEVERIMRGHDDTVEVVPIVGADPGRPLPRLELRGLGSQGADQVAELLASYLAAHRSASAPPRHP